MATSKKQIKTHKQPITLLGEIVPNSEPLLLPNFWKKNWLPSIIICVVGFLLYAYTINFGYILDDKLVITENKFTKKGISGIKDIFTTESFTGYFGEQKNLVEGARYRPLSIATFALEYSIFGLSPAMSHLINILLYIATGLLLLRLLFAFYPDFKTWYWGIPFLATLLFITHPIHTEVVANIKGRDEILSLLFSLLTLYFAIKYTDTAKHNWLLFVFFTFLAALFAKENAVTFIVIIPLTLSYFATHKSTPFWKILTPLLSAFGLYLVMRFQVIGYLLQPNVMPSDDLMNNPFLGMSFEDKVATILYTLLLYVKLLFFPHPLTHDYYPYHIPRMTWGNWQPYVTFLLYLAAFVYAMFKREKRQGISYGVLFFLITLSIVSNIPFTVGTFMNERFVYMPSVGFCIALAYWLVTNFTTDKFPRQQWLAYTLAGFFIVGYSAKTLLRVPEWKNQFTLNNAAYKVSKNSARANLFMGTALFESIRDSSNMEPTKRLAKLNEIATCVDKAIQIYPDYGSALNFKAGISGEIYKIDKDIDKLLASFYKIMEVRANVPFVEEFLQFLNQSAPSEKLVNFYHQIGYEYYGKQVHNYDLAIRYLNMANQIDPSNSLILNDLANIYQKTGGRR
ncbi:MAG: hypothetical protein KA974_06780 [Saprospiraceae bacterium]|nr:hypothetical protein [Saprospiraceae bacterium]